MASASTSTRFYVGTPDDFSGEAFRWVDLGHCGETKWTDLGNGDFAMSFRLPNKPTDGMAAGDETVFGEADALMISTRRGDKATPFVDVPSTLMADGKPMLLNMSYGYGMYTVMLGDTLLASSNGNCWDADAGDWDDEALAGQDGGLLDAYGSVRAAYASYMTRVSMMRDGWARQPPAAAAGAGAAAAPRAVGAKRERARAAMTNVMKAAREAERASQLAVRKVAREAERASQLAAEAVADAGFAARKAVVMAQGALIDLADDDEEEAPETPQRPIKRAAPRAPRKMVKARSSRR